MHCPTCGAEPGPGESVCPRCGSTIDAATSAGDRRVITALFADLVDYVRMVAEHDPEVVQARVVAALGVMGGAIERFGGTREKFIGDAVFAVFGWPRAHDDDAVRAVRAGLAIRAALADPDDGAVPLEVRIGIATGEVATLGGRVRLDEGLLTGPAVVTAARIQSLARPGEVLVDEATVRAARGRIATSDRGQVVLRGHPGPLRLHVVRGDAERTVAPAPVDRDPPLVGRDVELAALVGIVALAGRTGRGRVVVLEGEAGVGKTRMLHALKASSPPSRWAWTWTGIASYGGDEPYGFARTFTQAVAEAHGTDSGGFIRDLLFTADADPDDVRRIGGAIAAIARDVPFSGWEAEAPFAPTDPREVERVLTDAAGRYVDRLIERSGPRVVVVDDLHWIDRSSVPLFATLVERAARLPIVVLATTRPGFRASWATAPNVTVMRLEGLPEAATGQLATLVAQAALDADVARAIHGRTGGNPLFVTETVRAGLEDGTLTVRHGRVVLAGDRRAGLPVTLRAVLGARIDALPAVARELLGAAAVLGEEVDADDLAAVARREAEPAALEHLAEAGLLLPKGPGRHRFAHALVREAAYAALLVNRRRELHARAADRLEQAEDPRLLTRVARHRAAAGDPARAVPLLDAAARTALHVGAHAEAATLWDEAAELADDTRRRATLRQSAAAARRRTGGSPAGEG